MTRNYHVSDNAFSHLDDLPLEMQMDSVNKAKYVFRRMYEENPKPGMDQLGWHYHTTYELLYFLRGDVNYQIQQNRFLLQAHSLVIIKPGEYHTMIVNSSKKLDRIVIHFDDDDISQELRNIIYSLAKVYSIAGSRLSEEILQIDTYQKDLEKGLPHSVLISQLQIILEYLSRLEKERQIEYSVDTNTENIISYIHNHLSTIYTLDDICKNVHMSKSTVQKLILEYLQMPIMSYVRTQKCMLAKNLLRKGYSATQVCLQCGFRDYSTFYRSYKKIFGVSPSSITDGIRTNIL